MNRSPLWMATVLIVLASCSHSPEKKPALSSSTENQRNAPANALDSAADPTASLDLGGPCSKNHKIPGLLTLSGKQEEDLRKAKNWDALIEAAKQNVRDDCSISYRWGALFSAFVDGHRYAEATQTLTEMKARGFPLQYALLQKADSAFLSDASFLGSAVGMEFEERSKDACSWSQRVPPTA